MANATPPDKAILAMFFNRVIKKFNAPTSRSYRHDGFYLRMHYRWTFSLLIMFFFSVTYSWYYKDIIECRNDFNAEKTDISKTYLNICLSYAYIEDEDGQRRYLLYYRWVSWLFFFLASLYYSPRYVIKQLESDNAIILKKLCIPLFALFINAGAFFFIHYIVLDEQFLWYGYDAFPFKRDPETFTDVMSKVFPPFVQCEINGDVHEILASRKEVLGCHFTLMEFYEKIFLFLWFWMILLALCTVCHMFKSWLLCLIKNGRRRYRQRDCTGISKI